jgi:hypothetical protein
MPSVRGGIDEARLTVFADMEVAAPKVAVETRRGFARSDEHVELLEQPIEVAAKGGADEPAGSGAVELRGEPLVAVKVGP